MRMKLLTKKEALSSKICASCRDFLKSHKMLRRQPDVCISSDYECKRCKLMYEVLNDKRKQTDKLLCIWKML